MGFHGVLLVPAKAGTRYLKELLHLRNNFNCAHFIPLKIFLNEHINIDTF